MRPAERKNSGEPLATGAPTDLFKKIVEQSVDGLMVLAPDGTVLFSNQAACRILGRPEGTLAGTSFGFPVAADEPTILNVVDGQELRTVELRAIGAVWEGRDVHLAALRDITPLKRYEQELRAEKNRAQQYLDVAGVVLLGLDPQGKIALLNRSGCEVLGIKDVKTALGREWFEFVPADMRGEVQRSHGRMLEGDVEGLERVESRVVTTDGAIRLIAWHNAVVRNEEGAIVGTLSSGQDVTDRREMEIRLVQAERLSSMGMLAAGVAHEINNPLAYVLYNLESIVEGLAGGQEAAASTAASEEAAPAESIDTRLREVLQGTLRIKKIVKKLNAFSRVDGEPLSAIQPERSLESALTMASNQLKHRARVIEELGGVPPVLANDGRLSQVFLNLLINAVHSIEEGDAQHNEIRVRTWFDGHRVYASVSDTGAGIPSSELAHIFEPFVSSKPQSLGSGLGLAISKSIIEDFEGTIGVESTVGKGSCFTICLPALERTAVEEEPARRKDSGASEVASSRILVVDDEVGIRSVIRRMLRGHEVVEAESGDAARRILESDQDFALILCDIMMPTWSGVDLHAWLVERNPGLGSRFVFVTGGAFTPRAREYLLRINAPTLEKPFDSSKFRRTVRSMLSRTSTVEKAL